MSANSGTSERASPTRIPRALDALPVLAVLDIVMHHRQIDNVNDVAKQRLRNRVAR